MADTTPTPETDDGPEIAYSLVVHPEGQGSLVQVAIGLGNPTILLQMFEDDDTPGVVAMKVTTGAPFTQDLEGVNGIADFLEAYVIAIRSEQFQSAWDAKAKARAELLSELLSEEEEEFWESED